MLDGRTIPLIADTNHAPVAAAITAQGEAGVPTSVAVLAQCSDPDGDPLKFAGSPQVISGNATAAIQDGNIMITARGTSPVTVRYTISDVPAQGFAKTVTGLITFTPERKENLAPSLAPLSFSGSPGEAFTVDVAGAAYHDPEGDPMGSIVSATMPADQGTVVISGSSLIITPARTGTLTVSYVVQDAPPAGLAPASASGVVTVNAAPWDTEPPVIAAIARRSSSLFIAIFVDPSGVVSVSDVSLSRVSYTTVRLHRGNKWSRVTVEKDTPVAIRKPVLNSGLWLPMSLVKPLKGHMTLRLSATAEDGAGNSARISQMVRI